MNKMKITKNGEEQLIKPRQLNRFLDTGWSVVEKEVSKVAKAKVKASAEIIVEDETSLKEEDSSMSNHANEGEE
jgi:hypothetical protein